MSPPADPGWRVSSRFDLRFGPGVLRELDAVVGARRAVLVCSAGAVRRGLAGQLRELASGIVAVAPMVVPNPTIDDLDREAATLAALDADVLVAIGGGSAIDSAKALASLLGDSNGSLDGHLRRGAAIELAQALPIVAIPTTAGTGAEVTPFATIWDGQTSRKHSLTSAHLVPDSVLLDPELTMSLPRADTVASGLDAVSQALESLWNVHANGVSRAYASESLRLSLHALPRVTANGDDSAARSTMLEASTLAGLAIAITRTSLAHSMSYPLTAHYGLAHGIACGFTLPAIAEFNATACPREMAEVAKIAGFAHVEHLVGALVDLLLEADVPAVVRDHVPTSGQASALVEEMISPGRADNNVRSASVDDVRAILARTSSLLPIW